ncbi:MAG: phosphoribosyltransferase family protein [Flavobacteriales bacterium]|nr:phosphoribosyltransferase family protein [Flavobacteriales bacterium]
MPKERTLILTRQQIERKITRIAHEILERNHAEKNIVIVGVAGRGSEVAKRITSVLKAKDGPAIHQLEIELSKENPLKTEMKFSGDLSLLKGKSVVLVDDVLNSGRTLIYATKFLLDGEPKSLSTATLVDRFHRSFPVRADYVGLTLSTNLKEHITVEMEKGKEAVYIE